MGEMVEFPSNGTTGSGYLAVPASGSGSGVVVIQEWWGLNDQIKEVCERFAGEGFVALAPDLYRGDEVGLDEPDEAGKMMMALNLEQAAKDMAGAAEYLAGLDAVTSDGVGVTGFCMGGGLALLLATMRPDVVKACVPFYGVIPWPGIEPDWSRLEAPIQGHYASDDDFANAEAIAALEAAVLEAGGTITLHVYEGTGHAFTNHHREEVFHEEATEQAYERAFAFLHEVLG